MKNLRFYFLLFGLLILSLSLAQAQQDDLSNFIKDYTATNPNLNIKLISDDNNNSNNNYINILALSLAVAVILLILGYFGANLFDLPELKVFFKQELMQVFATALIAVSIFGIFYFLNTLLESSTNYLKSPCVYIPQNIPKSLAYANCYLDNLIDTVKKILQDNIRTSINFGRETFKSVGYQITTGGLYTGKTARPKAYQRLDVEIKTTEAHFLNSFLISLLFQKVFLNYFIPVLGPFFILLGLVARVFFFTRRLGGLLIAFGFGLLVVWPLTYLISWLTFQGSLAGSQFSSEQNQYCPPECMIEPPAAYNLSINPNGEYKPNSFISRKDLSILISTLGGSDKKEIYNKLISNGIQPCFLEEFLNESDISSPFSLSDSKNCTVECRKIPLDLRICNETACSNIPSACKIIPAMGLENFTNYKEKNSAYCSNEAHCSNCPKECKGELKEVNFISPPPNYPTDQEGIAIGLKNNTYNCSEQCSKCPSTCRYYTKDFNGDNILLFANTAECKDCKSCLGYVNSENKPICMSYVPDIAATDCLYSCGPALSLREVVTSGISGVCPYECRLYFDDSSKDYKDPIFQAFCETIPACKSCPTGCKLNVSAVINQMQTQNNKVSCSEPPTFNPFNEKEFNYNCARCPLSCRFNDKEVALKPFLSKVFYPIFCSYNENYKITCKSQEIVDGISLYTGCKWESGVSPPGAPSPPAYSPAQTAYLVTNNREICPDFIAPDTTPTLKQVLYLQVDTVKKEVQLRPNPYSSPECVLDKDAAVFCADPYCSAKINYPNFAYLVNISDINSMIYPNISNCELSPELVNILTNSSKYQFAVYLNISNTLDDSLLRNLSISILKPAQNACIPIINVPDTSISSSCGRYETSNQNQNRFMLNGAACPEVCRYLPLFNSSNKIAQDFVSKYCANLTLTFSSRNKQHNCEPFCNGLVRHEDVSYCQSEGYSCEQLSQNTYWVRNTSIPLNVSHDRPYCNKSVILNDSNTWISSDAVWWNSSSGCQDSRYGYINFTLEPNYAPYRCTRQSKYEGLDELINQRLKDLGYSNPDYRECGEIVSNPDYIFCGNYTINYYQNTITINALDNICIARYNARAAPALSYECYTNDMSTFVNSKEIQPIKKDDNCQQVPLVYRTVPSYFPSPWPFGGIQPTGLNKCSYKTSAPNNDFKAIKGSGWACPIRCRIANEDGKAGLGCTPEDLELQQLDRYKDFINNVSYACDDYHLSNQCKLSIKEVACSDCIEFCEEDCRFLPYVRTDCSMCMPSTKFSSATAMDELSVQAGLFAPTAWMTIGLLLIPSLILPSFSIVILLSFVRGLSGFLGGDIDIPGLFRLI